MTLSVELIDRIRNGDQEAFADLYRRYRDRLLLTVRCRLGPGLRGRVETEDVLQSVVRQAMLDLPAFERRGPGSLEHWLHACVVNKIRGLARWHGAEKRKGDVPLTDSVAEELAAPTPGFTDRDRFERLERALSRLPEPMREVILLRRIEGLSNAEAARCLGKSEAATAQTHARAMARLGYLLGADRRDG